MSSLFLLFGTNLHYFRTTLMMNKWKEEFFRFFQTLFFHLLFGPIPNRKLKMTF